MNVQILEKEGQPEWAIIPYKEYQQLLDFKEELDDIHEFDTALAMPQEKIPVEWVDRLLNGEHPIQVWREYRGLSQQQLAIACTVETDYICQLEMRQCQPSLTVLRQIAKTLKRDIEDLLENESDELSKLTENSVSVAM